MVLISSQFRRTSRIFYGFTIAFAFSILGFAAIMGIGFSNIMLGRWTTAYPAPTWILELGIHMSLAVIFAGLCLVVARRLARPTAYFRMTEEGLEFVVCPGIKSVWVLSWEDITEIREVSPTEQTRSLRWLIGSCRLLFEDYVCFVVERTRPIRELPCNTRLASVMNRFNQKAWAKCLPVELRDKAELHSIATGGVPCSVIVDAVNALIRDPDLRDRFCSSSGLFTIQPREQGETAFQFVCLARPSTEVDGV